MLIPENQIVIRLLVAAVLGLVIGFERERQDHPAGLRTHMILVVGSALAMTISINLAGMYHGSTGSGDPARLAAQVVSGIGFLGAGAILRMGINVKGLTTAASLWTMAVVGLAVGAGLYLASVVTTLILLVILSILNVIESRALFSYDMVELELTAIDRDGIVDEIKSHMDAPRRKAGTFSIDRDLDHQSVTIKAHVRIPHRERPDQFAGELAEIQGMSRVKISE
jgi:putative Mg2+ transporter-C (MgtC) family protein